MSAEVCGIVHGMPEASYHSHPSLSSTEARILLRKGGPARYRWAKDHPPLVGPSKKFDIGSAVHSKVLGVGYPVTVIPADLLGANGAVSTKAAKDFVADVRAKGGIPITEADLAEVDAMAESVLRHSLAKALFQQPGDREASVFGSDPELGVGVRARFDFLPDLTIPRPIAFDLKTTAKEATPDEFGLAAARYGYDTQQEHYLHALENSGADGHRPGFAFVVVEKEPPYLTAVMELPGVLRDRGRERAGRARRIYAECVESGVWPGLPETVQFVSVPRFVEYEEDE